MARQKRGAKRAIERMTQAKPSEVMQVISQREFQALMRAIKSAESDKNDAVSTMGGLISQAVEKKHLNKRAFAQHKRIDRLSDALLAEYYAHADHYREIGGHNERIARQGDMIGRPELAEASIDDLPRAPRERLPSRRGNGRRRKAEPKPITANNPQHLLDAAAELEKQQQADRLEKVGRGKSYTPLDERLGPETTH